MGLLQASLGPSPQGADLSGGLASRRDLPGIDYLRAAGLLDPVDLAIEQAEVENDTQDD